MRLDRSPRDTRLICPQLKMRHGDNIPFFGFTEVQRVLGFIFNIDWYGLETLDTFYLCKVLRFEHIRRKSLVSRMAANRIV